VVAAIGAAGDGSATDGGVRVGDGDAGAAAVDAGAAALVATGAAAACDEAS
jgi:hypothetical protein